MWYKNIAGTFFGLVRKHACDRRTDGRTDRRTELRLPRKGNPSTQMWFFVQLCSSWQDFNWLKGSRGLSVAAELFVTVLLFYFSDCSRFLQSVADSVHNAHVTKLGSVFTWALW